MKTCGCACACGCSTNEMFSGQSSSSRFSSRSSMQSVSLTTNAEMEEQQWNDSYDDGKLSFIRELPNELS